MTHADFSITYNFLNMLTSYDKNVGKLNSFLVVHIGGTFTVGLTTALDALCHLAAGITKLALGVFAAPILYFTGSSMAEEWSWSTAGMHFLQAATHGIGFFVAVPATFLSSPESALKVLFSQKIALQKKSKNSSRLERLERCLSTEKKVETVKSRNKTRAKSSRSNSQELKNPLQQITSQNETLKSDQIDEMQMEFKAASDQLDQVKEKLEFLSKNSNSLNNELIFKREEVEKLQLEYEEMKKAYEKDKLKVEIESKKVDELERKNSDLKKQLGGEVQAHRNNKKELDSLKEKFTENEKNYKLTLQVETTKVKELTTRKNDLKKQLEEVLQENVLYKKDFDTLKQKFKVSNNSELISHIFSMLLENSEVCAKNNEMRLIIAGQMANFDENENYSRVSEELIRLIRSLADELTCIVNLNLLEKAVMLVPCGHEFNEDSCTDQFALTIGAKCPSPYCNQLIEAVHSDPLIRKISTLMQKIMDLL